MKTEYWILITALTLFILGSGFDSKILNFLGWITLISEIGYTLIKTI